MSFAAPESRGEQVEKLQKSTRDLFNHCFQVNEEPQWKTLFGFIKQTCSLRPETFVQSHSSHDVPNHQDGLILWVLSGLLQVLLKSECREVCCGAKECILIILQLVECRNHSLLCYILREIGEISSVLVRLLKYHRERSLELKVYILCFRDVTVITQDDELKGANEYPHRPFEIQSLNHVTVLLEGILELIDNFPDDAVQFSGPKPLLWLQVLSRSLEYGLQGIRQISMKLLLRLIEKEIYIKQDTFDRINWFMLSLLGYTSDARNITAELEICLTTFLKSTYLSERSVVVFRFWKATIDSLTYFIMKGAFCRCTPLLQDCVGEVLLKACGLNFTKGHLLGKCLLYPVGFCNHLQPLVEPLCCLIREEINNSKVCINTNEEVYNSKVSIASTKDAGYLGGEKRRTRFQKIPKREKVRVRDQRSTLSTLLLHKSVFCHESIMKIFQSDCVQPDMLLMNLEGIRYITEVLARLFATGHTIVSEKLLQAGRLCTLWESAIYHACKSIEHGYLYNVLSLVLKSIGSLLIISGFCKLSSVALNQCWSLLELPWKTVSDNSVAGRNISGMGRQDIIKSLGVLNQTELGSVKACSLVACVAMPPSSQANARRICFFKNALARSDETVMQEVLTYLPSILATVPRRHVGALVGIVKDRVKNQELQMLFVKQLVPTVLAISSKPPQRVYNTKQWKVPLPYTSVVALPSCRDCTVRVDDVIVSDALNVSIDFDQEQVVKVMLQSFSVMAVFLDDASTICYKCLPLLLHQNPIVLNAVSYKIASRSKLLQSFLDVLCTEDCSDEHGQGTYILAYDNTNTASESYDLPAVIRKNIKLLIPCEQDRVVTNLFEAFRTGTKERNQSIQDFAVSTMGDIAILKHSEGVNDCVISLLRFALRSSHHVGAIVHVQMQRIANAQQVSISKLLSHYKELICNFVVLEMLNERRKSASDDHKYMILQQVSSVFGKNNVKEFLEVVNDALIPDLVCHGTRQSSGVLQFVAQKYGMTMRTLLVDNFKFIFLHLVKNGQQEDLHNVSEYLKSAGGFDMTALLHSEALNVLNLLLLHLSTHRKRVLAGVKIVAGIKRSVTVETEEDIANYLHPRLHGVIAYFNFVLLRVNGSDGILKAKLAINSLVELMKLMGRKYITLVKMKVIGMLRHCLSFKDDTVVECTLSAWKCFMESVETESLGPLLGQIVVALCPFVEKYAEQVSAMFEFFIIENRQAAGSRDALLPYFSDIYLVPEHPALKNVRDVLCASNMVKKSLQERVRHILKGVRHERSDVRRDALKALYKLQIECRNELEWCMVGSETIDPVITEIITTLLSSLRGASDTELRGLYGKCLGELGAIDPGKLEIPSVSTVRVVMFAEIDQGFARDLLQELARAYSASSNTRTQDCCAFAIQEVLRACESNNIDSLSDGTKFWSSLPADCQEVLQPHLDSNYTASIQEPVKYTTPIFKTMKLKNFSEWIKKWCIWLIHKLKQGLPKQIFLPCTLVFQHSTSPVVYMLPYVLMCVLRCVNHGIIKQVQKEVMAVLNNMAHTKEILPEDMYSNSMCAQTIFRAIDFLTAWVVEKSKAKGKGGPHKENEDIQQVKDFINEIPKDILGLAAFKCHAYTRALMYIEMFLSANQSVLEEHLGFLQKVYVALDEPDGVAGVVAVRNSEPTMQEEIIEFESTGNYRGAAALYEQIIQENPDSISYHEGLMRCLMRQGNVTSAVMHVDGLRERKPQWVHRLNAFRVEAAWKLGQWGDLEQYLKAGSVSSKNWDVNVGYLLLAAKQKNLSGFMQRLSKVRAEQMGPLSTASYEQGSYQRGYEYIVRLHMLQELEEYVIPLISSRKKPCRHSIERWRARLSLTQESFRICEPILSLRRVMLGLEPNKHNTEIGQYWLGSTQIARSAGHIQTSESFLLKVREYALLEFNIEKAKHLRSEGASHSALLYLQKFVRKQWSENRTILEEKEQFIHAQALLLIGQWMEETAHYDTQTVLKQYKSVIDVQPKSEEGHFYLGKYYDRLMGFMAKDRPANDFLPFIIRHYGHTLEYGCKYLYQCMPRLLTLWLDFGCKVPDSGKKSQERSGAKTVQQLNDIIQTMSERLPAYQYLIAFSQLISRICHPNCNVFSMLEAIILKLIEHYPQQCLWMMVAVNKSTHHDRQERCRTILEKAKQQITGMDKLITDMVRLTDKLLEVCNKPAESGKTYSMDKICRGLTRLTTAEDFSCIMVPLQSSMTVTLPAGISDSTKHNAFPGFQPTIERFDEKVEVLPSLQKPKKITACGSDGKAYVLLCKPKDDLRKDARLMEFNSVINKCLRKHPECRQRRLHIRTYAVIPLNEECGLLEWVPNTHGLRNILIKLYQERQVCMSGRELRDAVKPAGRDAGKLKDIFLTKLLPRHPPVFGEWFLRTFPDPTAWYSSRLSYAHTAAVMSMVGYVLGLGDRHGENILFDSKSGDCVHVDFNCLFNRGETLEVAEVVPFRLTHNMIHALGATGYEGAFRKSCEITMSLMRTECDTLLCVLKTFIHDPLVEWEKVKGQPTSHDATNEKAIKIIHDTEDRLQGKYPKSKGLPLSIEGQVDGLIKDATSIDNLSKMYIGWAAFM